MKPVFGNIGVSVEDYTKESLYDLLIANELQDLIDERSLIDSNPFTKNTFLQSGSTGPLREANTLSVHDGFVHHVLDMENFILILRVGILDPDAANSLVDELFSQGLLKPRIRS